jgi:hypothetical protein
MARRWKAATAAAALGAVGVAVIAMAANAGASRIGFTSGSASATFSQWIVSFVETGMPPGSRTDYEMKADFSVTFLCPDAPTYDRLGIPHGVPARFRYVLHLSARFSATADRNGVVKRSNAAPVGFTPPVCSFDGSTPTASTFALYHVRIDDLTHNVHTQSLRATTQPPPR